MSTPMNLYPDAPREGTYESGREFEDFVSDALFKALGLSLSIYQSKRYQFGRGESIQGIEIKEDRNWSRTQRLSIEIAEKTRINKPWIDSGIYSSTNPWLYVQGNYDGIWLFFTVNLKWIHRYLQDFPEQAKNLGVFEKQEPTIKAFYLPVEIARAYGHYISNGLDLHPTNKFGEDFTKSLR